MPDMKEVFNDDGYRLIRRPGHPLAQSHGYVPEHRLVAFEAGLIGENDRRHVHHKNHDKLDNRLENLEVKTPEDHARLHGDELAADWRRAIELYQGGMTLEQTGAAIGVHLASVARILKRHGVRARSVGRPRTIDRDEVLRRLATGKNYSQVAREMGVSREMVRRIWNQRPRGA